MNFNVGGFSESLKYSYQQFCKQDAEERECSRRLLMKLKKFEAKSFDLAAQTQVAQQMKNQYEKMLMHQNPLLWAQLQRNNVTDINDFELDMPFSVRSGQKHTREKAINTSHHSSTSSEQHSLNEEGVWPHTPSPYPEVGMQQLANDVQNLNICPVPYAEDGYLADNDKSLGKTSNNHSVKDVEQKSATNIYQNTKVKDFQAPSIYIPQSIPTSLQLDDFIPGGSSTPSVAPVKPNFSKSPSSSVSETKLPNKKQSSGSVTVIPQHNQQEFLKPAVMEHVSSYSNETTGHLVADSVINESLQAVHDMQETQRDVNTSDEAPMLAAQLVTQQTTNELKPFCLDSESECADDPISGPLSGKNAGEDDSDSFWN